MGKPFEEIWEDVWPTLKPIVEKAFAGQATYIEDFPLTVTRNGYAESTYFTFSYSPVMGADGEVLGVLDSVIETTRRVHAEQATQRANADLEAEIRRRTQERDLAWNYSQDLQLIVDRSGAIRATNNAWSQVLGWTGEESLGRGIETFTRDDEALQTNILDLVHRPDQTQPVEMCLRHRDGSWRWIAWLSTSQGHVVHLSGRHVSAQKEAERQLEEAEERLRQAQKMEVFGQLTGGIAHDFNNLLQAVSGSLEMLGRKHVHTDDGHRLLRLGGQALERAAHLTRQLLAFARKQSLEVKAIDLDAALATSIELARRSLPENVAIEQRVEPGTWSASSDVNQLDVAMLNLIINARDALPEGGSIVVSTRNVVAPGEGLPATLADGAYVQVAVADSGTGMTDDVKARVFEPFFTTKGVGKGTGLGLSQVYGFAHQSGGSIAIDSAVGAGTTVRIFLPRAASDEIAIADEPDVGVWRGRETVLVVDDDRDVRELAVACLREYGYRVLEAASGVECLELLGREAAVDLLLIDYAMPEMNGAETVRLARRMRPELQVLFITGYADLRALHEHVGPNAIVQKPFKLAQLAERVAVGLARRPAVARRVA